LFIVFSNRYLTNNLCLVDGFNIVLVVIAVLLGWLEEWNRGFPLWIGVPASYNVNTYNANAIC
jgi:hypothetical protein